MGQREQGDDATQDIWQVWKRGAGEGLGKLKERLGEELRAEGEIGGGAKGGAE